MSAHELIVELFGCEFTAHVYFDFETGYPSGPEDPGQDDKYEIKQVFIQCDHGLVDVSKLIPDVQDEIISQLQEARYALTRL